MAGTKKKKKGLKRQNNKTKIRGRVKETKRNGKESKKCKSKQRPKVKVKSKARKNRKRKHSETPEINKNNKKKKRNEKQETAPIQTSFNVHFDWMTMTKSPVDTNHYKIIQLPNGLTACLVSKQNLNDCSLDSNLTQSLHSKTGCSLPVQEFNEKFIGLHQDIGSDLDHMTLLDRVATFPSNWINSIDKIVDKDFFMSNKVNWEGQDNVNFKGINTPLRMKGEDNVTYSDSRSKEDDIDNGSQWGISICVKSGSFQDPKEFPGMAHLCEHCVFEGTKKFAKSSHILFKCCAEVNASTERDRTVYYAYVHTFGTFKKVVTVMADMMTSPLILDQVVESEIQIVDSESTIRQSFDAIRCHDLLNSLANEGHPLQSYACGDDSTLNKRRVSAALRQWHGSHYTPSNLIVVLEGPVPLSTLESILIQNFYTENYRPCPSSPLTRLKQGRSFPFDDKKVNKIFLINPFRDLQVMLLTWIFEPEAWLNFGTKPLAYICRLLAHQGQGSLHEWLMSQGLILSSYSHSTSPHFYTNSVSYSSITLMLELTDEGMKNVSQILVTIFSYIQMLCQCGPKRRIFHEMRQRSAYKFHYDNECTSEQYSRTSVQRLAVAVHATMLQNIPPKLALVNSVPLLQKYDPQLINKFLNQMTPNNLNVMLLSRAFAPIALNVHPNILTEWTAMEFSPELKNELVNAQTFVQFELPKPNIYLNDVMNCRPIESIVGGMTVKEMTYKLNSSGKASIHCHTNNQNQNSKLPIVATYTFMITSCSSPSANSRYSVMIDLWVKILQVKIQSKFYDATLAGILFDVVVSDHGIFIYLDGPAKWLASIWCGILDEFTNFEKRLDRKLFFNFRSHLEKVFGNTSLDSEMMAFDLRLFMTTSRHTTMHKFQKIIQEISYEEFVDFTTKFKSRMWIVSELFGVVTKEELEIVTHSLMKMNFAPLTCRETCDLHTLVLPVGDKCLRVKCASDKNFNSFIINYFQLGSLTYEDTILCQLIVSQISPFIFNSLRVQDKIGYRVWTFYDLTMSVSAIEIWVNTKADKFTTGYVDERIDEALMTFYSTHLATDEAIKNLFQIQKHDSNDNTRQEKSKSKFHDDSHLSTHDLVNDPEFPSKIRNLYKKYLPHDKGRISRPQKYRKLSIQVVGNKRHLESTPKQEEYLQIKINRNKGQESNHRRDLMGQILNDAGKSSQDGIYFDIPVDVEIDDDYFITDLNTFKKQLMIYPNLQ